VAGFATETGSRVARSAVKIAVLLEAVAIGTWRAPSFVVKE